MPGWSERKEKATSARSARALLAVAGMCLVGCSATKDVVRARFAKEHRCPEALVDVTETGANRYRARGCEAQTTYVCTNAAALKGNTTCNAEGIAPLSETPEPHHPEPPPLDPARPLDP